MPAEKPTLESEKKEYSETTLPSYLEYEQWTHEEALLIFCDCDPQLTTVSWVANGAAHGTSTGQNVLENAQLFREWTGMRHIPLEIQTAVLQHPALADLDIPTATQEDWQMRGGIVAGKVNRKSVDEVAWKWIHCIQIGFNLAKAHEALMRKSPEVDKSQLEQFNQHLKNPVGWWIDWAKRRNVSVPWLAWAEENDLIPETPPEFDLQTFELKGFNYSIPSPIQKFIQEQHDLLAESKDVITKLQGERKDGG